MFHPATAIIVSACALAVVLRVDAAGLLVAAAAVAAAYAVLRVPASAAWGLLRRARILLLSIVIVHGWLTPGPAVWAALGPLSPTLDGARDALLRGGTLVMAIAVIALLIARTTPTGLAAGLATLARPLGPVADVFALRLALTLDLSARPLTAAPGSAHASRVQRVVDRLAAHYQAALGAADQVPALVMPDRKALARRDWLAMCAAVLAVAAV